ncbi:MAG: glycosyltransferase [Pseudomonadales bacterium]
MSDMLQVAMVIDPWAHPYNGTVHSARRFVNALEPDGFRFRILAIEDAFVDSKIAGQGFPKLSVPGFNAIIDSMRAPLARPVARLVDAALEGVDILHVQYPFFLGFAAISAARRRGIPVICSFHVQPENILDNLGLPRRLFRPALYALFRETFFNRADLVIAPSPMGAELLREHGVTRPIEVLSNGTPDRFFRAHAPQADAEQRCRVVAVGRLAREKRHDVLLRAVASSAHRGRIDLLIGGVGPEEDALRKLARALGVDARFAWLDEQALLEAYGSADLIVHAATAELEGMSVLEAMAAGNAVLVSSSEESACARLIEDPACRFRPGDVAELRQRMDLWLNDPVARARQGAANRIRAEGFSHERSSRALASIYRSLVSSTVEARNDGR